MYKFQCGKMPPILAYFGNRNRRNDRYMAIVIRENGTVKTYLAFTDNLVSILSVMDEMLQRFSIPPTMLGAGRR